MFEALYFGDQVLGLLLCAALGLAAWGVARLAPRRGLAALRRVALGSLATIGLVAALVALRLLIAVAFWRGYGWTIAADRLLLSAPLLALPLLAILALTVPRLRRLAREARGAAGAPVDTATRVSAGAPGLLLPVRVAAVAALVDLGAQLFASPAPAYLDDLATAWAIVAACAGICWAWTYRRWRLLGDPARRATLHPAAGFARAVMVALVFGGAFVGWFAYAGRASALPDRLGMAGGGHAHGGGGTSVTALTGPRTGTPDRRFTLTARRAQVALSSGATVDAWTFDGQLPGPELRARQGELLEITLINQDIDAGVTLHWHGLDVPNAEDGVAGVTQDAVLPGRSHTYRFVAAQAGTYWYHSHQQSSEQVRRGLFGAIIIDPPATQPGQRDIAIVAHNWSADGGGRLAYGAADTLRREAVAPGTPVRLRLVNSDAGRASFALAGVPFRVAAIDGTDLNAPTDLVAARLLLADGGRYDLTFTMPDHPVLLAPGGGADTQGPDVRGTPGLLLSPDGAGEPPAIGTGPLFDPANYGRPAATPFGATSRFDRQYAVLLDDRLGFYNGQFTFVYTINGVVFPDTPTFVVKEGELVKVTIANRSFADHPMHLHGHHILVLGRNGTPVAGSPWWADTLNVAPGEEYEVAFLADNPGVWMDHCHNLAHAAVGMVMYLNYEGVTTPFEVGPATPNQPE